MFLKNYKPHKLIQLLVIFRIANIQTGCVVILTHPVFYNNEI